MPIIKLVHRQHQILHIEFIEISLDIIFREILLWYHAVEIQTQYQ